MYQPIVPQDPLTLERLYSVHDSWYTNVTNFCLGQLYKNLTLYGTLCTVSIFQAYLCIVQGFAFYSYLHEKMYPPHKCSYSEASTHFPN